jgi:very-short-patch-repair endonuclease
MKSKQANDVYAILKETFPNNVILKEHYVRFKYTRLFFDFYIKDLGVLIEVQGRQHTEYVDHFHGSKEAFRQQKHRDNLKIQYVEERGDITLVRFNYDEKITKDLVLEKICRGLEGCFYE